MSRSSAVEAFTSGSPNYDETDRSTRDHFLCSLAPSLFAETLSQPSFRIEVADGWVHSTNKRTQTPDDFGNLISIHHPNRPGVLKIQSLRAPAVSSERLRLLTNVDGSEQLDWESWGDFSGYQHSYFERGSLHRQWWLTDGQTVVTFVHSSWVESNQAEMNEIDNALRDATTWASSDAKTKVAICRIQVPHYLVKPMVRA